MALELGMGSVSHAPRLWTRPRHGHSFPQIPFLDPQKFPVGKFCQEALGKRPQAQRGILGCPDPVDQDFLGDPAGGGIGKREQQRGPFPIPTAPADVSSGVLSRSP